MFFLLFSYLRRSKIKLYHEAIGTPNYKDRVRINTPQSEKNYCGKLELSRKKSTIPANCSHMRAIYYHSREKIIELGVVPQVANFFSPKKLAIYPNFWPL